MELMVIKNAIIIGLILYCICDKNEENRLKLSIVVTIVYIVANCLSIQLQKNYYSVGILLCGLEAYFIRVILCVKLAKEGEKIFIKNMFYYYIFWGILNFIEYVYSILVENKWSNNATLMEMLLKTNNYWRLILALILCILIIKLRVFELIPYRISRLAIWSMSFFEMLVAFGMCIEKLPYEIHKEIYKILMIFTCSLLIVIVIYKKKKTEKENAYYEQVIHDEYYSYEEMYRREMIIKNIRHDLANHIQVMQGLSTQGKNEEQMIYQKELMSDYNAYFEKDKKENVMIENERAKGRGMIRKCAYFLLPLTLLISMMASYYIGGNAIIKWINISIIILCVMESVYFISMLILEQKGIVDMKETIIEGKESENRWREIKQTIEENINDNSGTKVDEEQIQKLHKMMESIEKKYGDDEVLGVMLNYKDNKCSEQGIDTDWNINLPTERTIRKIDIVEIFGNIIDNAIEACQRMQSSKKYIKISTCFRANFWMITVENSKNVSEQPVKSKFKTNKKGDHGLGMKIVSQIVNKYDGVIKYYDNGNSFVMELMLNLEDAEF